MQDVFISYNTKNQTDADFIKRVLESNGISCWMAPSCIPTGSNYAQEIPNAIRNAKVFLLLLSNAAQMSIWVPKELDLAITANKPIIPFQIDGGMLTKPFNFRLTNIQRIEAYRDLENAYAQLVEKIKTETGHVRSDLAKSALPSLYTYYQMLGISDISQLSVERYRNSSDVTVSLSVPVGINSEGQRICLDLHHKADGPHALVIGPSGSGKSEFLKTFCLSLCLRFSPKEVRLHIIDQEGGDVVGSLQRLPHLGICLTDKSEEAALDFIQKLDSEVQRRYEILEKHSVSNIYQYLKLYKDGGAAEALPHLFIIFDEIRTMKVEYPEFYHRISELGSKLNAALLGIHIIFTTNNCAGLVDDITWYMGNCRVCSTMQRSEFEYAEADGVSRLPGRLYIRGNSMSKVHLIQLAYCQTADRDNNASGFEWFFGQKSEMDELIDRIARFELD